MENRKTQYTKNIIRESFLSLLLEKPVEKITVTELCAKADINRSTFYAHYLDVYDLKERIEQEFFHQISAVIRRENAGWSMLDITKALQANADFCRSLFGKYGDYSFLNRCISAWLEGARQNRKKGDSWRLLFVASGAAVVTAHWIENGMEETAEEMAHILGCLCDSAYAADF